MSVALVTQQAKRVYRVIMLPGACLTLPHFSTLSHKQNDLRKNNLLNIKCVLRYSLERLSKTLLILRIFERDTTNSHTTLCKVCVIVLIF